MRYKFIYILSVLSLLLTGAAFEEILNDKRKQMEIFSQELDEIRIIINRDNSQLYETGREIDSLKNEKESIDKFLEDYKNERFLTPLEIAQETNIIIFLEEEITLIQKGFKDKVINLYKHGKNYDLELLLSAKTPNEYLRRNQYLQKFSQNRKKELRELKTKKFILEEKKKLLTLSTSSQRYYIETKRALKTEIDNRILELEQKKILLNDNIENNGEKIVSIESSVKQIRTFVTNFLENKDKFTGSKPSRINYPSENFEELKGILNIPLDFALISAPFGETVDNQSGLKAYNNGVDFSIARGSKVFAVAKGKVVLTGEIPFYGKVVIISHDNGYRTLYGKLNSIEVESGNLIKNGQLIGRSGENVMGQGLHFELWKDKTSLNPADWLKMN